MCAQTSKVGLINTIPIFKNMRPLSSFHLLLLPIPADALLPFDNYTLFGIKEEREQAPASGADRSVAASRKDEFSGPSGAVADATKRAGGEKDAKEDLEEDSQSILHYRRC